jgi:hypothetical protein
MKNLNETMEISPKPPTALFVNRTVITEDAARGIAEGAKLAMFGVPPKKPLFGPKPETLVKIIKVDKQYNNCLRIRGAYSIEYIKRNYYPIRVDDNVLEVTSGNQIYKPEGGNIQIVADERKVYHKEGAVAFNGAADEIPLESFPIGELEANGRAALALARIDPASFARLEDTAVAMAVNVFKFRICQAPDEIGQVVSEALSFAEFAMIFTPYYVVTLEDQRTKATKTMQIDGMTGRTL